MRHGSEIACVEAPLTYSWPGSVVEPVCMSVCSSDGREERKCPQAWSPDGVLSLFAGARAWVVGGGGAVWCPVCGKQISNKYNLRIHVRDKHEQQHGSRPICTVCRRNFKNANSLRVHTIKQHGYLSTRRRPRGLYHNSNSMGTGDQYQGETTTSSVVPQASPLSQSQQQQHQQQQQQQQQQQDLPSLPSLLCDDPVVSTSPPSLPLPSSTTSAATSFLDKLVGTAGAQDLFGCPDVDTPGSLDHTSPRLTTHDFRDVTSLSLQKGS
ncbi:hypothetical protein Pmani_008395 [Petrolisthes manimaculis]|uniref:C2H2-type domain-containing protein n=1 Tax=Petrolisthes manimaculis TaxID=1843537 RepID=A0AAE1Q6G3_9EUCA|nr:hypothetical protein Pmani_022118 [Petrolisthes manimaculis]KAK4320776.1 hypothetical protein Pmani_008395 [Petrolisthes manimaculis]